MNMLNRSIADRFVDEFGEELIQRHKIPLKAADQFLAVDDDECVYHYMLIKDDEGNDVRLRVDDGNTFFSRDWTDEDTIQYTLEQFGLEEADLESDEVKAVVARLKKIGAIQEDA